MSVRGGLLAVLTLGPAYGAQVHAELGERLGHRRDINVGQVYATLERLSVQGLVRAAGVTDDGLPLYRLTDAGAREARRALSAAPSGTPDWAEMQDRVLIATSLPGCDPRPLLASYRASWSGAADAAAGPQGALAALASAEIARAALSWLGAVEAALGDPAVQLARAQNEERPKRGRRPAE